MCPQPSARYGSATSKPGRPINVETNPVAIAINRNVTGTLDWSADGGCQPIVSVTACRTWPASVPVV